MIDLPDDLIVQSKIEAQNAHYDVNSIENSTGRSRNKYKLCGCAEFGKYTGVYTFFLLFSDNCACDNYLTLCVNQDDWENRDQNYLKETCSYIDVGKIVKMDKSEISAKIKDSRNGFRCVARLKDEKFAELREYKRKFMNKSGKFPLEKIKLITMALAEANEAESIMSRLGLPF